MRATLTTHMRALGRTPLFEGCSQRQLRRAERFCTAVNVRPAQELSRPGERPDQLVIILTGRAAAFGSRSPVRWLGPGDWFGAATAQDLWCGGSPKVVALTAGSVVAVARREFAGLFGACPSVAARLDERFEDHRIETQLERVAATLIASSEVRART
jgi:CRP-like cAMP-binding protein